MYCVFINRVILLLGASFLCRKALKSRDREFAAVKTKKGRTAVSSKFDLFGSIFPHQPLQLAEYLSVVTGAESSPGFVVNVVADEPD